MWKKTKEIARSAEYMFKNKDEVQKRVLEATRDDDDQITENEYMTVAHLTADPAALSSIRKTLWKRFSRITKRPVSCRKALQILDYCIRYGSEKCLQVSLEGTGELQMVANSHHFSSDKPREYMNEDQCRNLVQNLLAFIKNRTAYDQARQSGQSTIQRVQSFYVEPLQVKIKPDNQTYYGGNTNTYATSTNTNAYGSSNSSSYGNTTSSAMNDIQHQKASYSLTPESNQPKQTSNTASSTTNNGIQWSSDSDSELETDPREMSRNRSPAQTQGNSYQSQQNGFNLFNQQPQQKQNTTFQNQNTTFQSQSSNPFQTQPAPNPFQTQPTQNPFNSQQQQQTATPNPFNSQQQQYNSFNQQQQQHDFFSQPSQQQSYLNQQEKNFFNQPSTYQPPPQQPPSADELLFGPSPTQQKPQYVPPQPDPIYNGIVDFSSTPMQPYSSQPVNQNKSGGMLDEFGDLVDLNLNKGPARAHGRPEQQRGYNNNQSYQYNQYQQKPY